MVRRAAALHVPLPDGGVTQIDVKPRSLIRASPRRLGAVAGQPLEVAAVEEAGVGRVVAGDLARAGEPAAVVRRVAVRVPVGHHEVDPLGGDRRPATGGCESAASAAPRGGRGVASRSRARDRDEDATRRAPRLALAKRLTRLRVEQVDVLVSTATDGSSSPSARPTCSGGNDATRFGRVAVTPSPLLLASSSTRPRRRPDHLRVDAEVGHRLGAERLDQLEAAPRSSAGRAAPRGMQVVGAHADDDRCGPSAARTPGSGERARR